jgi:Ca2+-binding EF-hand superfamily protein
LSNLTPNRGVAGKANVRGDDFALPESKPQISNKIITADNYNSNFLNYDPEAQFKGKESRSAEELIKIFKEKLLKRGGNAIFQIGKHFNLYDKNKNKRLDLEEFSRCIREFGSGFSTAENEIIFNYFDFEGNGTINYEEFLRIIRGPMSDRRKNAVLNLFNRLDKKGDGCLDVQDIKLMYNAKDHPDAQGNVKTVDQVYYQFIESINTFTQTMKGNSNKDKISKDEWLEYYNNVSSSFDKDDQFLSMLNNCWNR